MSPLFVVGAALSGLWLLWQLAKRRPAVRRLLLLDSLLSMAILWHWFSGANFVNSPDGANIGGALIWLVLRYFLPLGVLSVTILVFFLWAQHGPHDGQARCQTGAEPEATGRR